MSLIRRIKQRQAEGQTFDFEAAAHAREEQRKAAAQAGEVDPAPAAPAQAVRPVSPAQRHRHRMMASASASASSTAQGDGPREPGAPQSTAEAEIRLLLIDHQRSLKAIQSQEQKIALKREILPQYEAWCEGVLAADTGAADVVLTTILVWRIDAGDYFNALPLIDYVMRHKLELPAHITRTPATFITEEIAEAALKAFDQGGDAAAAFPHGILSAIEDLVDHDDPDLRADMPDEVRAKLQKAIARAILLGGDGAADDERSRQEEALKRCLRALELDDKAGVKKDIEQLRRKLNKPAPEPQVEAQAETQNAPPLQGG